MQFNGPTFLPPPTQPEMQYPPGVRVESSLRVWAISRWRSPMSLATVFLNAGFHHLLRGSPRMYRLEEGTTGGGGVQKAIVVHFTNPFDAYLLLGRVFFCGCEFIAFTLQNIFTNYDAIFPNGPMHTLPYEEEGAPAP